MQPAFEAAIKQRAEALLVGFGTVMQSKVGGIVDLAAKGRLPSIYPSRELVDAGGLTAYAVHFPDLYRRAATYVDKILKGEARRSAHGTVSTRGSGVCRPRDQMGCHSVLSAKTSAVSACTS